MGAGYKWVCDTCGREAETNGPWEFYRDKSNRRRDYGHPTPRSEEAIEAGVSGFYGQLRWLSGQTA